MTLKKSKSLTDLVAIIIFGGIVFVVSIWAEGFEYFYEFSRTHEPWQLDELFTLMAVLSLCFGVYSFRRWRELSKVIREVNILQRIIPICAWCKKVRTDEGYWRQVEAYMQDLTEAEITHGICPECAAKED